MADFRVGECTKWVGASHKQCQKVGMYFKTDRHKLQSWDISLWHRRQPLSSQFPKLGKLAQEPKIISTGL